MFDISGHWNVFTGHLARGVKYVKEHKPSAIRARRRAHARDMPLRPPLEPSDNQDRWDVLNSESMQGKIRDLDEKLDKLAKKTAKKPNLMSVVPMMGRGPMCKRERARRLANLLGLNGGSDETVTRVSDLDEWLDPIWGKVKQDYLCRFQNNPNLKPLPEDPTWLITQRLLDPLFDVRDWSRRQDLAARCHFAIESARAFIERDVRDRHYGIGGVGWGTDEYVARFIVRAVLCLYYPRDEPEVVGKVRWLKDGDAIADRLPGRRSTDGVMRQVWILYHVVLLRLKEWRIWMRAERSLKKRVFRMLFGNGEE